MSFKKKDINGRTVWLDVQTLKDVAEKIKNYREKYRQHSTRSSLTSEPLISSICPSARMCRLADSVTTLPFLYQVMVGGGTALDSHSRVTDLPTSTFTTTGESPLLSRILGGTGRQTFNVRPKSGAHWTIHTVGKWTHQRLWGRCVCRPLLLRSLPHSCTFLRQTLLLS